MQRSILMYSLFLSGVWCGCPFQNPFWFVENPIAMSLKDGDDTATTIPNVVRVIWGQIQNFKCVDYFQVEYFQTDNPIHTVKLTRKINRHKRSIDIAVSPCIEYGFKVIASEDWKGMREDFEITSQIFYHKIDYIPRFRKSPMVEEIRQSQLVELQAQDLIRSERRKLMQNRREEYDRRLQNRNRERKILAKGRNNGAMLGDDEFRAELAGERQNGESNETAYNYDDDEDISSTEIIPEVFIIRVSWSLEYIDYPVCLDHFELLYYDVVYNETGFSKHFSRNDRLIVQVSSDIVPCGPDYEYVIRVFGINGEYESTEWIPPSCIVEETTTVLSSTIDDYDGYDYNSTHLDYEDLNTETILTTPNYISQIEDLSKKNEKLKNKLDGLKQEYERIGSEVYESFKRSLFMEVEDFIMRKRNEKNIGSAKEDEVTVNPRIGEVVSTDDSNY